MKYSELKAGLNAALQTLYPTSEYDYYGIEVTEGYNEPCFFTRLETGESRPENRNTLYHHLLFIIQYFPKEIDEEDIMEKVDSIRELFELNVKVQDRSINCIGFDWGYTGTDKDYLEISVDLEYLTDIRREDDNSVIATDAELRLEVKNYGNA